LTISQTQGRAYLADFGATVCCGDSIRETSVDFYPEDLGNEAQPIADKLMLAVTLLKKAQKFHASPTRMTISGTIKSLNETQLKKFLQSLIMN
jgi:hypothetical protein